MTELAIFKEELFKNQPQIVNLLGSEKEAMRFLSNVTTSIQKTPKLLECSQQSLITSFLQVAQLGFMPSDVSGEAYVLPYNSKTGMQAQFQLGYQGLITLFYRSGVKSIVAEIIYKKDDFSIINGVITHKPNIFDDRGVAVGAYVIATTQQGGDVSKVMSKDKIMAMGKRFSKSFKSQYSPWNEKNDPELWMWKKTVLKQVAKLLPKNETIFRAVEQDNQDSVIADRKKKQARQQKRYAKAMDVTKKLKMKNMEKKKEPDVVYEDITEDPQIPTEEELNNVIK